MIFYFILLFISSIINGQTITLAKNKDISQIDHFIDTSFIVTDYSFTSDILFSNEEFCYLTDLKIGREMTGDDLKQAVTNLFRKNCFESITISLEDDVVGKKIFFSFVGLWRFETLKVSGIWVGRDWYKQYYVMESGDPFDVDKHRHSMQKIIDACKKEGFFDVRTKSSFVLNKKTKSVTVHTVISRGWRFSLDKISLILDADESIPYRELKALEQQLYKKFLRSNHRGKYARDMLETQAKNIKDYLAQRGFLLVTIDLTETLLPIKKAVRLQWHITLGKKRNFIFFGARFFSYTKLLDRLLQFGRSAWIVPASILADELRDMYNAKGFWDVSIDASDEGDRALFIVTEGKRAVIQNIKINGAQILPEKYIIKKCFNKVKRHAFFDRQLFDEACEQLTNLYLAHGLVDAKIMHHEYVSLGKGIHTLLITVSEGDQVMVSDIAIPGFEHLLQQGPFFSFYKKKKKFCYNNALIQAQKRWLFDYFRMKGYFFVTVESSLCDGSDNTKQLVWHIVPGKQICFGKTIIQGASTFPFLSIMRELRYQENDVWDAQKVRRSFIRLKNKEIFDAVSLVPLPLSANQVERSIMLKIHQDDPFELRARAGLEFQHIRQYQTFGGLTYKIGGTFLAKNPSNNGDYFRFDGDVARSHREVHLTYFYPWLFNLPLGGLFQAYGIRYEQPGFINTKKNIYTIFEHGVHLGLQHKSQHVDVGVTIGFEVSRTKAGDDSTTKALAAALAHAIAFDPRLLNKRIPFWCIEPTILIDHLDNNLNPTKGMLTLINLKGMFPTLRQYTNAYFLKLLVEHSWFVSIAKAVAAFRIRFGHIFHRCFADIMPNERFYLGGANSVRSYEADLAPPLGCFIDNCGKKNIVPRGGKTMLNINIELRLPILKKIGFVVFQDLGILSGDDFIDFSGRNLVGGTGFGIRYFTPIGPLRFDIAWKWKKHVPEERRFNWYLTFGQAF